jgi:hypothetical protein
MLRATIWKIWQFLQTPMITRSTFRISIREALLMLTVVAVVGGLLIERREHAKTKRELVREKNLLDLKEKSYELLGRRSDSALVHPPGWVVAFRHSVLNDLGQGVM